VPTRHRPGTHAGTDTGTTTTPATGRNRGKMEQPTTPATERTHDIGHPEKPEMGKTEQKQGKQHKPGER